MGPSNEDEQVQRTSTYLVGINVKHSIAPPMHNYVAKALGRHWYFDSRECPTIQDVMKLFQDPSFAGGVVTMPYKIAILPYLDSLDEHVSLLGACNNVYITREGKLRGSNTDWRGVEGCLKSGTPSGTGDEGRGKPALLVGAGGAARAAIYVLYRVLGCHPIYIANRDQTEVDTLREDTKKYGDSIKLIHVSSLDQAKGTMPNDGHPYFVVGTVPDFEPQTQTEIQVRNILEHCFANAQRKGVLLDMCFKPRRTRTIKLAEKYGWTTVEGTHVIGHQIKEQYRLWCGVADRTPVTMEIQEGAWQALREAADQSTSIN